MVFYAAFNSISVISQQSYHSNGSHYSRLSNVSLVLGCALKRLAQGHSHEKTQRSSTAQTQDPWIMGQTLYHWTTWDPNTPPSPIHKSKTNREKILQNRHITVGFFLAHLSTTCSGGAFRVMRCLLSVVHSASSTISLNIFSSQTAGPIWTKLGRNVPWEVLFKKCSQNLIP